MVTENNFKRRMIDNFWSLKARQQENLIYLIWLKKEDKFIAHYNFSFSIECLINTVLKR
jgi:hypothetical protein